MFSFLCLVTALIAGVLMMHSSKAKTTFHLLTFQTFPSSFLPTMQRFFQSPLLQTVDWSFLRFEREETISYFFPRKRSNISDERCGHKMSPSACMTEWTFVKALQKMSASPMCLHGQVQRARNDETRGLDQTLDETRWMKKKKSCGPFRVSNTCSSRKRTATLWTWRHRRAPTSSTMGRQTAAWRESIAAKSVGWIGREGGGWGGKGVMPCTSRVLTSNQRWSNSFQPAFKMANRNMWRPPPG